MKRIILMRRVLFYEYGFREIKKGGVKLDTTWAA